MDAKPVKRAGAQLRIACRGFLAWWLGELRGMLPRWARRPLSAGPSDVVLEISDTEVVATRRGAQQGEALRIDIAGAAGDGRDRDLARLIGRRNARAAIRLPAGRALRKTLTLPLAAEADLRNVLFFEIDRHTPFTPEQVCFDHRVLQRNRAMQQLEVELVVVARSVVEKAVDVARSCGVTPAIVGIAEAEDESDGRRPLNLLADGDGVARSPGRWRLAVVGLTAVLFGLTAYLPFLKLQTAAEAASRQISDVAQELDRIDALRQELEGLQQEARFLTEKKRQGVVPIQVLLDLSRLLPDHTWLFEFHVTGQEVRILGYSPKAAVLIGMIEDASRFQNVRFRSPVTQAPGSATERFDISFELAAETST